MKTSRVLSIPVVVAAAALSANARAVTATVPGNFTASCGTSAGCFKVTNTASPPSIYGVGTIGVQGDGNPGIGVWGNGQPGVRGETNGPTDYGVVGLNHGVSPTNPGGGVLGSSPQNYGVVGSSITNRGVFGTTAGGWPAAGIYGENSAPSGTAMVGTAMEANSTGIYGQGTRFGIQGFSPTNNGIGMSAVAGGASGTALEAICSSSCASNGGYAGVFTGNVKVTGSVTATSFTPSDARLKRDVEALASGLRQIMGLRPVTYRWKDDGAAGMQIGLIAQELRAIFPELVQEDRASGMLSVNYTALVPVLIKGMQEQQSRLDKLEHDRTPALSSYFSGTIEGALALGLVPLGLLATLYRRRKPQ